MQNHPPLDIDRICIALADCPIGHTIQFTQALPTTMQPAHAAAAGGEDGRRIHGRVFVAEEQTAGRGRRGRNWAAPPGRALLMSVLLQSPALAAHLARLPPVAGLAALKAIEQVAPDLSSRLALKWPNDLVVGRTASGPDAIRKVGGILIESVLQAQAAREGSGDPEKPAPLPYAVVGIGINANQAEHELPAVVARALPPSSLRLARGKPVDRSDLLIAICRALAAHLETEATIVRAAHAWRDRLALIGELIWVYPREGSPYGAVARAVTQDGALVVIDDAGVTHRLTAEDVSIRPGT
jgi:BirA family transcriptional regulator, biotin operon repressor / biotin---[acetyl-CoA-carboxylase] ligase